MQSKSLSIHESLMVVVTESEVVAEGERLGKMTAVERFFEMCRKGSPYFCNERSSIHGWEILPSGFAYREVKDAEPYRLFGFCLKDTETIVHLHTYLVVPAHEI